MRSIMAIAGWIMVLIAIFLLISNGDKTVKVINALSDPALKGIKELQGR